MNDKRYGVGVIYNRDTKTFTFKSGTTGETISANCAIGVTAAQKASDIEIAANEILRLKKKLNLILAENTGQNLEKEKYL